MALEISASGYTHRAYAESLAEFGRPLPLVESGGWLLRRDIPGSSASDAMACYPMLCCRDWTLLGRDLSRVEGLVSVIAVTDPLSGVSADGLAESFPDLVASFKTHFVVRLDAPLATFVHSSHRRKALKALDILDVEEAVARPEILPEWIRLYENLKERHAITGIPAFSEASFVGQLKVPGLRVFAARLDGAAVGMTWWFVDADKAYYHLGAYSDAGYRHNASFALFWRALGALSADGIRYVNLGGAPGLTDAMSGLARFKQGWSNASAQSYLCGRIVDRPGYQALSRSAQSADNGYFPAYRQGEFA